MRVAIVDSSDRFLRWATREEVHTLRAPHRSVQVLIVDSKGRAVLQKRHREKRTHAGYWDMSCSGHVEEIDYPDPSRPDDRLIEIYDAVAHRELFEELGVRTSLEYLGTFAPLADVHYEHFRFYLGESDGPFVAQEGEVEEVRAFDRSELDALFANASEKVTPSLRYLIAWARERGSI